MDGNEERIIKGLFALAGVTVNGDKPYDITIHDRRFYRRVLKEQALGLGESYMDGWWDCPALDQFFHRILAAKLQERVKGNWKIKLDILKSRLFNLQSRKRAYQVGERHYDIGNDLYRRMLDKRMIYTCAYWKKARTLVTFKKLYYHFYGRRIAVKTRQHSIRRAEFDNWLLQRSGVTVHIHQAKEIRESGGRYIIDNRFSSSYLVGAAGTYCPVYRTIFQRARPRIKKLLVTTMEAEFQYDYRDDRCYLWFFDNRLSGYSWYVPKGDGRLNIGIGGKLLSLKGGRGSIRDHWRSFREKLNHLGLVRDFDFPVRGCNYFLHHGKGPLRIGNAFIVGDSAALASRDMGEGIGAAVKSGILAAEAIARQAPYAPGQVGSYSIFNII